MKNWEDIVKDKLEGYESPLPEGGLAEFRARRNAAGSSSPARRSPLIWIVPAAVAAGLAAILFLRRPAASDESFQPVLQPAAPVAAVTDSTDSAGAAEAVEPTPVQPLIAQAVTPKTTRQPAVNRQVPEAETQTEIQAEIQTETQTETAGQAQESTSVQPPRTGGNNALTPNTPYIPEVTVSNPVGMKIGPAVGVVAGGGLLAAAIPAISSVLNYQLKDILGPDYNVLQLRSALSDYPYYSKSPADAPIGQSNAEDQPDQVYRYSVRNAKHRFPLKVGLSARIPLSEKLSVVTGLEYTRYSSDVSLTSNLAYRFDYERTQNAHYLGIPVRLDWMLASGKYLDVYLGGGFQGDYCLGATIDGDRLATKDGLLFSLLGAGGVQFNVNRRIGLYVEPEISWAVPYGNSQLSTWRSDNPFMFCVATGLRINL